MELTVGKYQIISDPLNFIVQERRIVQDGENKGKEYWVTIAYHSSLEHTCLWLFKRIVSDSEASTLTEVLECVRKASQDIIEAVTKWRRGLE